MQHGSLMYLVYHQLCIESVSVHDCCRYFLSSAQFEGSLGRLTFSSVHNPRPLIDIERGPSSSEDDGSSNVSKELRRIRQLLMDIEKVSSACALIAFTFALFPVFTVVAAMTLGWHCAAFLVM